MSDQNSLIRRWPLFVATIVFSAAFAWVFLISIERAVSARSAELSLETGNVDAVKGEGLALTPSLGTLPQTAPEPRKPMQPAPWWPALLFALAFLSGWGFRHSLRETARQLTGTNDSSHAALDEADLQPSSDVPAVDRDIANALNSKPDVAKPLSAKNIQLASGPDLTKDFPWDEAALGDLSELSGEERVFRLEKQNASKAEIIKALERLVTENREKWLHQDETEARLNQHIQELSDDLHVAVRQLQQLQTDKPAPGIRNCKNAG